MAAWVKAHPPAPSVDRSDLRRSGASRFTIQFAFRADPGRVVQRALIVQVTAARGGGSAVRGDGLAEWLPAHPSWDRVPKSARVITARITIVDLVNHHRRSYSASITAARQVRRIVRVVNRAYAIPPLPLPPCPFVGVSETISLSFRARRHGPVLARATEWPGCAGNMLLTVRGRPGPRLSQTGLLWRLAARIERRDHQHHT